MQDIADKNTLSIFYEEKVITSLPLTGTYAALQTVTQCQQRVDELVSKTPRQPDPFVRP